MVPDTDYFYSTNPYSNSYENIYLLSLSLAGLGVYAVGSLQGRIVAWMCPLPSSENKISFPIKEKFHQERVQKERGIQERSKSDPILYSQENVKVERVIQERSQSDPIISSKEKIREIPRRLSPAKGIKLCGIGKHKEVYEIEDTPFVIKVAKKYFPLLYKNEYIAYILSQKLGLDVVPFVSYIDKGEFKNLELLNQHPKLKVPLTSYQRHYVIIQNRIIQSKDKLINFDTLKAHKALIFNFIAGREDQEEKVGDYLEKKGSIVDCDAHVWEIGNVQIGNKLNAKSLKKHWLKEEASVWQAVLEQNLVNHIMAIDSQTIENAIKDEWDDEISVSQVNNNLRTLQSILKMLTANKCEITFDNILKALPK